MDDIGAFHLEVVGQNAVGYGEFPLDEHVAFRQVEGFVFSPFIHHFVAEFFGGDTFREGHDFDLVGVWLEFQRDEHAFILIVGTPKYNLVLHGSQY